MAKFSISLQKTLAHEGFYSNDPDDLGKETYKGISRIFHPKWNGWTIIDSFNKLLASLICLTIMSNFKNRLNFFIYMNFGCHYKQIKFKIKPPPTPYLILL